MTTSKELVKGRAMKKLYHELMHEIYFTRAMMFLMYGAIARELCEEPLGTIICVTNLLIGLAYFIYSYMEYREGRHND